MFASKSESSPAGSSAGDPGEKPGGRVVLWVLLALVLLAGGAYAAAAQLTSGKVPQGTTVSGVDIGGEDAERAEEILREQLADRAEGSVTVVIGEEEREVAPGDVGLAVDHAASVEAAGGGDSWAPARLWTYFTGGDDLDAEVSLDEEKFDEFVSSLDEEFGSPPVDGAVTFVDGRIRTTEPEAGVAFERDDVRTAVLAAYLDPSPRVELETTNQDPEIDEADVARALDEFANPAVSDPVALVFDGTAVQLTPEEYTPALALKPVDGALEPTLKKKRLRKVLDEALADDGAPEEATVAIRNGRPEVVPDKPGVAFNRADVNGLFLDLVAAEAGNRSAKVKADVVRSDFRTEDAEALGITEVVADVTTEFPHAEYRNVNIGRAAEIVNGTVLKPGETFSMNETVGERTRANGFTTGIMIANGVFKEDLGGGVSQMATTLFNGGFFAGLEDVEHKPHSFYISRYPVGREATVAWGAVDLRFRNNTEHGVLIESSVKPSTPSSQGVVRVRLWSTKVWDIEAVTGARRNFTQPKTRTLSGPDCMPNTGYAGFDITVKRIFRKPGQRKVERTEDFHTTYTPSDTVVCRAGGDD